MWLHYVDRKRVTHTEIQTPICTVSQPQKTKIQNLTTVKTSKIYIYIYIYIYVCVCVCVCMCVCVCRLQNVFLRCPTPRLHCFLSSHWPSFRFLSFMAFLVFSIQIFFGLPRALFCFGIHFNAILGNLPPTILSKIYIHSQKSNSSLGKFKITLVTILTGKT